MQMSPRPLPRAPLRALRASRTCRRRRRTRQRRCGPSFPYRVGYRFRLRTPTRCSRPLVLATASRESSSTLRRPAPRTSRLYRHLRPCERELRRRGLMRPIARSAQAGHHRWLLLASRTLLRLRAHASSAPALLEAVVAEERVRRAHRAVGALTRVGGELGRRASARRRHMARHAICASVSSCSGLAGVPRARL